MDKEKEFESQMTENEEVLNPSEEQNTTDDDAAETENKDDQTDITAELEASKKKCETLHNDYLYLRAEFENYKRNALKEKSELIKTAGESIFREILPVIDDFERALREMEKTEDVASVKEGVSLIYKKFIAFLEKRGVKAIETENMAFDTDFHEAVTMFPAPSDDMKGKVIDCTEKGYTLNEKVIRYAKVVVGQ